MDCSDLETLARSGQLEEHLADAEVVAHLRECGACEALYGAEAVVGQVLAAGVSDVPSLDLAELRSELDAALEADRRDPRAAVRDLSTRVRVATSLGIALATALLLALLAPRDDWSTYPTSRMWLVLGAFAVAVAWGVREVLSPLTELWSPRRTRGAFVLAAVLPLAFAVLPVHQAGDESPASPVLSALGCLTMGVAYAAPTAVWLLLARRSPVRQDARTWVWAASLGVVGNLVLQVHCPYDDWSHLVLGHAPLLLVWAFGALVLHQQGQQGGSSA